MESDPIAYSYSAQYRALIARVEFQERLVIALRKENNLISVVDL